MTLAEKVERTSALNADLYAGLREGTGNTNRDVPFYPGFLWLDAVYDPLVDEPHFIDSFRLLSGIVMEEGLKRSKRPLVIEFGCGPAHMVHFIYGRCDYIGIDGNPDFLRFNSLLDRYKDKFLFLDIAKPIWLYNDRGPVDADIVCAFEVLEHLYEKDVDTLLGSVVRHMKPDALFMCTASLKHRSTKDVHLTVQSRQWWVEKFNTFGLKEVDGMAERLLDRHPYNWRAGSTHAFALSR